MDVSAPFSSHNKVPFMSEAPTRGGGGGQNLERKALLRLLLKTREILKLCFLFSCYWRVLKVKVGEKIQSSTIKAELFFKKADM